MESSSLDRVHPEGGFNLIVLTSESSITKV